MNNERVSNNSYFVLFLSLILVFSSPITAKAATPVILFNGIGSGCTTAYTGAYHESNRYVTKTNLTVTAINILIGNSSSSNFLTTNVYLFSDSSTTNSPDSILDTFTPDTLTGTGSTTAGRFIGSHTFNSGTKFWVVPSVRASIFPRCYATGQSADTFPTNGINFDTSTSNSNTLFRKVYSSAINPPTGSTWDYTGDTNQNWQLSIESSGSLPVNISLSILGNLSRTDFRKNNLLSSSVDVPSNVTFYENNKRISGCINISSSGGTATCNWKPRTHSSVILKAIAVPISGSYTVGTSQVLNVSTSTRTNSR